MSREYSSLISVYLAVIVILISAAAPRSSADENRWSTNGPYGGSIQAIAVHPFQSNRLYVGSACVWESTDGGDRWSPMRGDSSGLAILVLKLHPIAPDTMLAGTPQGLYKSANGGASWSLCETPGGIYDSYPDVEFHPDNPAIIFAAASQATRSTDGGQTWTALPIPASPTSAIEIDSTFENRVYVGASQPWQGKSLFRSDDLGDTWENITGDLDSNSTVQDVAVDPVGPNVIYLGRYSWFPPSDRALAMTTDGGIHWSYVTPPDLSLQEITCVRIAPADHNIVYVTTIFDGVYRGRDGGETWEQTNNGIRVLYGNTLIIDPITNLLYFGNVFDGIYRSSNGADSWERISDGITAASCTDMTVNWRNADSLAVAVQNGLYLSGNGGSSWQFVDPEGFDPRRAIMSIICDPVDPAWIYASFYYYDLRQGGIYRTTDGGNIWGLSYRGLPEFFRIGELSATVRNGATRLYLGAETGLFFSDDRGENWLQCPNLSGFHGRPMASRVDPDLVLVSGHGTEVFKSIDGGNRWELLDVPPGGDELREIVCDPVDANVIYASWGQIGIFRSTDGGSNWEDINSNLPRYSYYQVTAIAVNPLNTDELYACPNAYGIYVTYNGGQDWEPFNEGLWTEFVYAASTIIDPQDSCRIFLATYGKSVWSYTKTTTGVRNELTPLPEGVSLSAYPNPFNSSTTINYSLPRVGHVTITICNILGQSVATLYSGIQSAGAHSLPWDATPFSSGLYFARLIFGGNTITTKMLLLK